jgi:alpha-tubulin suppressor-like RCC1 family protein
MACFEAMALDSSFFIGCFSDMEETMTARTFSLALCIACLPWLTACGGGGNGKEDVPVDPAGEEEVEDQAEDEEQEDLEEVEQEMLPGCGNGTVEEGEGCDDGDGNSNETPNACREDCSLPVCGDAVADDAYGEQCDDGNGAEADGCDNDCTFSCTTSTQAQDCDDGLVCTDDLCDEGAHTCTNPPSSTATVCRPASGDCDAPENCDGVDPACPLDAFQSVDTTCRPAAGDCDVAESCTGDGPGCPADAKAAAGTPCDDGDPCTYPDECNSVGTCAGTPDDLHGVAALATGDYHSCALLDSGGVMCWGANYMGQLGDGTTTESHAPVEATGLASVAVAITAGTEHICVRTSSGGVKCWGSSWYGTLGNGTSGPGIYSSTAVDVTGLTSGVVYLSSGIDHTCAVRSTGGAMCWGRNNYGQLGDGTTTDRTAPVAVSGLSSGVAAIAGGLGHTCVLTDAGGLKCWGGNDYGKLGDGTTTDRLTPVDVSGMTTGVLAVSVGGMHTCAMVSTGGLKCWGNNTYGQLGDGTTVNRYTPVDVSGLASGVVSVSAGMWHTCVVTDTGGIKCWGNNVFGRVGDGTTTDRHTPVDVVGIATGGQAVIADDSHTCALLETGGVMCWGYNATGQLGDGTTTTRNVPVDVICD